MLSWVDNILCVIHPEDVNQIHKDFKSLFKCTSEGVFIEYVGSKIDIVRKSNGIVDTSFTQPVIVQKLKDEYITEGGRASKTPAVAGQVLVRGDGSGTVEDKDATVYRLGTATYMYVMQWPRPDIYNST